MNNSPENGAENSAQEQITKVLRISDTECLVLNRTFVLPTVRLRDHHRKRARKSKSQKTGRRTGK